MMEMRQEPCKMRREAPNLLRRHWSRRPADQKVAAVLPSVVGEVVVVVVVVVLALMHLHYLKVPSACLLI